MHEKRFSDAWGKEVRLIFWQQTIDLKMWKELKSENHLKNLEKKHLYTFGS